MLGWMIKRGLDGGRDATDGTDDTQVDQPDTPGPVFAARAFKSALFGTPARPDSVAEAAQAADKGTSEMPVSREQGVAPKIEPKTGPKTAPVPAQESSVEATPRRLPGGILLTPGTGTTRRKRVSFGHDVEHGDGPGRKAEFRIDRNARRSNLFGDSRAKRAARSHTHVHVHAHAPEQERAPTAVSATANAEDDNLWEEIDDADADPLDPLDPVDPVDLDADITVDLNEPHSQSGQYWKAQFQRYQEDAKAEMGKLLKYKQLAKSYAKMKDAEAVDLHAKLREEKDRVADMERRISELAAQISRKRMDGSDRDYQELISDLTRQTALAVQYRNQVKELEAMLHHGGRAATSLEHADADADTDADTDADAEAGVGRRRQPSTASIFTATSPRTQRTLLDTQRELRRAREQLRELAQARDEVRRLKASLRAAEQRARQSDSASRALAADLAASKAAVDASATRIRDLEARAHSADAERRRKDDDLRLLQRKFDALKDDAKARVGEAEQVLNRKNELIAKLRKQLRETVHTTADASPLLDLADANTDANDNREPSAVPRPKNATAPTTLAALEEVTRSRYESLANKRATAVADRNKTKPSHLLQPPADAGAGGLRGLVINADDLDFAARETALPHGKRHRHSSRQKPGQQQQQQQPPDAEKENDETIHILEDESSHFEMPPRKPLAHAATAAQSSLAVRARGHEIRRKGAARNALDVIDPDDDNDVIGAVAAANVLLRRRRGAEPLRPIDAQSKGPIKGGDSKLMAHRETRDWEAADPVTAAAAAAADASRLSLSSDRAAAAVARIEKRRAERNRELERLRDKENLLPA